MSKRRTEARGKPCMIRIPGVCNRNNETTVLAHYRMAGYSGVGIKPDDDMGAWACSSCHDLCDSRTKHPDYGREDIRLMHAEGVMRTWMARKTGENW